VITPKVAPMPGIASAHPMMHRRTKRISRLKTVKRRSLKLRETARRIHLAPLEIPRRFFCNTGDQSVGVIWRATKPEQRNPRERPINSTSMLKAITGRKMSCQYIAEKAPPMERSPFQSCCSATKHDRLSPRLKSDSAYSVKGRSESRNLC